MSETIVNTQTTELNQLLEQLQAHIENPRVGLPQEIFYFVSRLTPMVNVDLLIQNKKKETLLTWRKDRFYTGWHLTGGILRFKETADVRIQAVAESELGANVSFEPEPIAVYEKITPARDTRGHFISLLYRCQLTKNPNPNMECKNVSSPQHGQWYWHPGPPDSLIPQHDSFRKFMEIS